MTQTQSPAKGRWFAFLGIIMLSPDALLLRLIGESPFSVMIWRGFLAGAVLLAYMLWRDGRGIISKFRGLGRLGWGTAFLYGVSGFGFLTGITYADVATALVIVASSPIWAALIGRLVFGERLTNMLIIGIAIGMAGVLVAAFGEGGLRLKSEQALGLGGALFCAVSLGFYLNIMRRAESISALAVMISGMLIAGTIGLFFGRASDIGPEVMPYMLLLGLLIQPLSFAMITASTKHIPGAEVALFMLLEAPLGAALVWLVLHEEPSLYAIIGGVLIVAGLLWTLLPQMGARRRARTEP